MALNPPLCSDGRPLRLEGEHVLAERPDIEIRIKGSSGLKMKAKGTVFVTTARLIFVNAEFGQSHFRAFDMPLAHLIQPAFRRPFLGPNYLEFRCRPQPLVPKEEVQVTIRFHGGGAESFMRIFERARSRVDGDDSGCAARAAERVADSLTQGLGQMADSVRVSFRNLRGVSQHQLRDTAGNFSQQVQGANEYIKRQVNEASNYVKTKLGNQPMSQRAICDSTDPTVVVVQQPPLLSAYTKIPATPVYPQVANNQPLVTQQIPPKNDYGLLSHVPREGSFYPVFEDDPALIQSGNFFPQLHHSVAIPLLPRPTPYFNFFSH